MANSGFTSDGKLGGGPPVNLQKANGLKVVGPKKPSGAASLTTK